MLKICSNRYWSKALTRPKLARWPFYSKESQLRKKKTQFLLKTLNFTQARTLKEPMEEVVYISCVHWYQWRVLLIKRFGFNLWKTVVVSPGWRNHCSQDIKTAEWCQTELFRVYRKINLLYFFAWLKISLDRRTMNIKAIFYFWVWETSHDSRDNGEIFPSKIYSNLYWN